MNSVYLYLHRIMIRVAPDNKILTRKKALFIISNYLRFVPKLRKEILEDMIKWKLLKKINRDRIKVINLDKSKEIDTSLLIKIIESGMFKAMKKLDSERFKKED